MRQISTALRIATPGGGLHEVTAPISDWIDTGGIADGLLTVFCRHTSASLLIQENAAPAARRDLERWFARIAPESPDYEHDDEGADDMPAHLRAARRDLERWFARIAPESDGYEHDDEGPDDMPAHLRAAVTATSLSIPVIGGAMALGTWQGVYLFEHRARPHRRTLALHLLGE